MNYIVCNNRDDILNTVKKLRSNRHSFVLPQRPNESFKQNDARMVDFILNNRKVLIGKKDEQVVSFCGYL